MDLIEKPNTEFLKLNENQQCFLWGMLSGVILLSAIAGLGRLLF